MIWDAALVLSLIHVDYSAKETCICQASWLCALVGVAFQSLAICWLITLIPYGCMLTSWGPCVVSNMFCNLNIFIYFYLMVALQLSKQMFP